MDPAREQLLVRAAAKNVSVFLDNDTVASVCSKASSLFESQDASAKVGDGIAAVGKWIMLLSDHEKDNKVAAVDTDLPSYNKDTKVKIIDSTSAFSAEMLRFVVCKT